MKIDLDADQGSADWIKAGRPLDTIAAIKERAAKDKQDWLDRVSAAVNAEHRVENAVKHQSESPLIDMENGIRSSGTNEELTQDALEVASGDPETGVSESEEDETLIRLNKMCDVARELGYVIDCGEGSSSKLTEHGTLARPDSEQSGNCSTNDTDETGSVSQD